MSNDIEGTSSGGSAKSLFDHARMPHLEATGEAALLQEALERSGYLLELRVARVLERAGFRVLLNRVMSSRSEQREIDIIAVKDVVISPSWRRPGSRLPFGAIALLRQLLLFECVNNPKPLAFFARVNQAVDEVPFIWSAHDFMTDASGEPVGIRCPTFNLLQNEPGVKLEGNFCATQYCAFDVKQPQGKGRNAIPEKWIATQSPHTYDPIESLCLVMRLEPNGRQFEEGVFYYARPVLLSGRGNVLVQHNPSGELCIDEVDFSTLMWSPRAEGLKGRPCRIEVVSENGLGEFLPFMDRVGGLVAESLGRHLPSWPNWGTS